jgi:hypothetical protein
MGCARRRPKAHVRMLMLIGYPMVNPSATPFKLLRYLIWVMTSLKHLNGQTASLRLWPIGLTCL